MELLLSIGCFILLYILHKWDLRDTPFQKEMIELVRKKETKQIGIDEYLKRYEEIHEKYNMK